MKIRDGRKTHEARMLSFMTDLHTQLKTDDEPRAIFTAMSHHLGWTAVAAMQDLELIKRAGWKWHWVGPRPTKRLAQEVCEHRLTLQRERVQRYIRSRR
jgi:hypothetical protein